MEYQVKTTFLRLGRRVPGVLYEPEGRDAEKLPAILVMHSDEDYLSCPTGPEMARRGYRVLCANPMTKEGMFFSLAAKAEAVKQAMEALRGRENVGKIFLMGHSGGATLMTAYQAVAENGPDIFKTAEMIYPWDGPSDLPPADGVILPDANWGNAVMQLFSLDPAITDEDTGKQLDPFYDLFEPENGFNPEGSSFPENFISRFLSRQGERNNDILEYARIRLRMVQEGKGRFSDDEPLVIPGSNQGFFNNKLYAQDIRLLAHTAEEHRLLHQGGRETVEIVHSLRDPENSVSLTSSLEEGGRIMTVKNYLSSYAIRTLPDYGYGEDGVRGIDWHSTFSTPVGNAEHNTVLANYKSMDHEGCPGPTTSPSIAAYALETYGKVIDAATDDYMGSTMNDVYSAHVGSFIRNLLNDENGNYVYEVAHRLWEDGTIPFFDGEYWYLVSGPDFDPDGYAAVQVIYSATPAELLAE